MLRQLAFAADSGLPDEVRSHLHLAHLVPLLTLFASATIISPSYRYTSGLRALQLIQTIHKTHKNLQKTMRSPFSPRRPKPSTHTSPP